jgi:recombinational DNA repair ATPase RecF
MPHGPLKSAITVLEDAKKQNDFLISETTLANLGDEVSNHRRNLKENISKLFIDYHNCVKDISKCLSGFVNSLCTFTIYSESCMSDCNAMEEILKNN